MLSRDADDIPTASGLAVGNSFEKSADDVNVLIAKMATVNAAFVLACKDKKGADEKGRDLDMDIDIDKDMLCPLLL